MFSTTSCRDLRWPRLQRHQLQPQHLADDYSLRNLTGDDMRIVPRTEYGLPADVTSSDGSYRPYLSNPVGVVWHYTGVNVAYRDRDVAASIRRIQAVFASTKPFEYNYVIGQADDGLVYEFAGEFRAAHSAGENDTHYGVLFLNGVGEPLTDAQIVKARWLLERLRLPTSPDVSPHREMPGAATACPGDLIVSRLGEITAVSPPSPPLPPPPPPPSPDEVDMIRIAFAQSNKPTTEMVWTGTELAWIENGHAAAVLAAGKVTTVGVTRDQVKGVILASKTTTRAPFTLDAELTQLWASRA